MLDDTAEEMADAFHVQPVDGDWQVARAGMRLGSYPTKDRAVAVAHFLARRIGSVPVIVHAAEER